MSKPSSHIWMTGGYYVLIAILAVAQDRYFKNICPFFGKKLETLSPAELIFPVKSGLIIWIFGI